MDVTAVTADWGGGSGSVVQTHECMLNRGERPVFLINSSAINLTSALERRQYRLTGASDWGAGRGPLRNLDPRYPLYV
jgi:hypothetical protein